MKNNANIGQWTTINLTLSAGATLTNIAMTYNGATASAPYWMLKQLFYL